MPYYENLLKIAAKAKGYDAGSELKAHERGAVRQTRKIPLNAADKKDHSGIAGLIRNKQGELLMLYHNKFKMWTPPVGKVDPGTSVRQSLRTELKEEVGVSPQKVKELFTFKRVYPRDGKSVNVTAHVFDVQKYTGVPKNLEPHKHETLKWMTLPEINKIPAKKRSDAINEYLKHVGSTKGASFLKFAEIAMTIGAGGTAAAAGR